MMDNTGNDITWEVIDTETIQALVERKGATALIDELNSQTPTPQSCADQLVALAVEGRISPLKKDASSMCDWAAEHGARRIENALIELDRVLASEKRGEALLHAQALTRFISRHIDPDIKALKEAIKGKL